MEKIYTGPSWGTLGRLWNFISSQTWPQHFKRLTAATVRFKPELCPTESKIVGGRSLLK